MRPPTLPGLLRILLFSSIPDWPSLCVRNMAYCSKPPTQNGPQVLCVPSLKTWGRALGPPWVRCPHLDWPRGTTVAMFPAEGQLVIGRTIPLTLVTPSDQALQLDLLRLLTLLTAKGEREAGREEPARQWGKCPWR